MSDPPPMGIREKLKRKNVLVFSSVFQRVQVPVKTELKLKRSKKNNFYLGNGHIT